MSLRTKCITQRLLEETKTSVSFLNKNKNSKMALKRVFENTYSILVSIISITALIKKFFVLFQKFILHLKSSFLIICTTYYIFIFWKKPDRPILFHLCNYSLLLSLIREKMLRRSVNLKQVGVLVHCNTDPYFFSHSGSWVVLEYSI